MVKTYLSEMLTNYGSRSNRNYNIFINFKHKLILKKLEFEDIMNFNKYLFRVIYQLSALIQYNNFIHKENDIVSDLFGENLRKN